MPEFRYYLRGDGECNTIKCADCARYSDTTPVDAAWLESMGAEWRKGTLILKANGHEIYQWSTGKRWSIQDESVSVAVYTLWYDNPTRGQLLHLLAALTK